MFVCVGNPACFPPLAVYCSALDDRMQVRAEASCSDVVGVRRLRTAMIVLPRAAVSLKEERMPDITKRVDSHDGWIYEAYVPLADDWMIDNWDDNKITLSNEQAKEFEEKAMEAGLTIAVGRRRWINP